jgi:hypothetical protein
MRPLRRCLLVVLGLLVNCGGSGEPANSPDDEDVPDAEDLRDQTEEACEQLRDCDLVGEGQLAFDDCIARGLYTVEDASNECIRVYYAFEECVADQDCNDLKQLFGKKPKRANCKKLADAVRKACNVNVL